MPWRRRVASSSSFLSFLSFLPRPLTPIGKGPWCLILLVLLIFFADPVACRSQRCSSSGGKALPGRPHHRPPPTRHPLLRASGGMLMPFEQARDEAPNEIPLPCKHSKPAPVRRPPYRELLNPEDCPAYQPSRALALRPKKPQPNVALAWPPPERRA